MTDCQSDQRQANPDRLLQALAHADRRAILTELADYDGETIGVEQLAARVETVPTTELRHRHLPVLVEAGIVAFDSESGVVEYTPTDAARALLDVVEEQFGE